MKLKKVMIDEIVLPKYNPRHITPEALESLKKSIKEFDYIDPIIVNDVNMHVVGGNQRVVALQELGYTEIDAVFIHEPDINREKAINIRLNNSSGDWDIGKLDTIFNDLEIEGFDLTLTGFATENLQPFETETVDTEIPTSETITSDLNTGLKPITGKPETTPEYVEPEHEIIEDNYQQSDIKVHVAKGDLWKLGNHYLFCGDATNKDDLEILLTPERERAVIDLVFTDPPYGMKKEKDGVHNDNLNYDTLLEFNKQWIPLSMKALKSNGSWYCWGIDEPLMDIYAFILKPMIKQNEITFRNLITWNKGAFGSGGGTGVGQAIQRSYFPADEKCLFVMKGVQGFNNNSDNYFEKWEPIRSYLEKEAKKVGLNNKQLKEITGVGMYGHWFTKSQWTLIPKEHYIKLQNYYSDAFKKEYDEIKKEYDEIKKEYDEIKKEWYSTRAYFNNTHDMMTNIWEFQRVRGNERKECGGHATPKPIKLCTRAILSSSRTNENVLDIFGGSGSTLIACEETNRNCYMMELDPYYCQVIINRWEHYTGQKAIKIN